MAKTQVLEYTIYLPDQVLVDQLNAQIAAGTGPGLLLKAFNWQTLQMENLGVLRAPYNAGPPEGGAAVEFADEAGIYPPALPLQLPTVPLTAPNIRSPWFGSGSNFPTNVATFTRKSGGWFGIPLLFGTTTKFYWVGKFAYVAPAGTVENPGTGTPVTEPAPIPQRLQIAGFFDDNSTGDLDGGQDSGQINSFSSDTESSVRQSARWPGDMGFAFRPGNISSNHWDLQPHTTPATNGIWDRWYFRVRKYPTDSRLIYEVENFSTSGSGHKMFLTPDGKLSVIGFVDSSTPQPKFTTSQIYALNTWHKVDVLIYFWGTSGPPEVRSGFMDVWVDGVNVGNATLAPGGLAANIKPSFVKLGDDAGSSEVQCEIDFANWRSARLPKDKDPSLVEWASGNGYTAGDYVQTTSIHKGSPSSVVAYKALVTHGSPSPTPATSPATWARVGPSQDWLHGNRNVRVRPTAFSANHVGASWANTLMGASGANLDQWPAGSSGSITPHILTTVAAALAAVDTDVAKLKAYPGVIGCVAAVAAKFGTRGTANGTLGAVATIAASSGGGTKSVSTALTVEGSAGAFRWNSVLLDLMNGTTDLLAKVVDGLELRYTSGGTGNTRVNTFQAVVEIIGMFGREDQIPPANVALPGTATVKGIHNGPYIDSPWYGSATPPFAPVALVSGTYVSNGDARYLTFPLPPHLIIILRTSAGLLPPAVWWTSMLCGHHNLNQRSDGFHFGKAEKDPTFVPVAGEDQQQERYRIQIIGQEAPINENGITYQYFAVCDPAKRAMICGAETHEDSQVFPTSDPLEDGSFTPTALFTFPEGSSGNNTLRAAFKGPGHAAQLATTWAGLALTDYIDFAQGVINFRLNASNVSNYHQTPYIAWRSNDGTGNLKVWQHVRYTGNGTSPRTITGLSPAGGGKLPLVAMGMGNSNGYIRMPFHTGTNSQQMSGGAQDANGIRAGGVDSITVGSSLNANAQTYDLFVFLGGTTDSNGDGFSDDGTFYPVEPDTPEFDNPNNPGWEEPIEIDPGTTPGAPLPPDTPGGDYDDDLLDSACVGPTTNLANLALQRIGVSQKVTTLISEQSAEAEAIRTAYDETLDETLRAHRWPFATRVATLALVSGSAGVPATSEWQYAYSIPASCLYPRRIVAARGKAVDPTPPPFREMQNLIFTNQANAVLEFTIRPHCPALNGDATFRSAWMWRLAAELAPVLTRMPEKQQHCLEMWQYTIGIAERFSREGAPGVRPSTAGDADANVFAAKLQVINTALLRIGAQTISDLSIDQSREAVAALLVYEDELRSTLRDFPWPFATRYADAGLAVPTLTLVAGTASTPATPDWWWAYRMPTGAIGVRRLIKHLSTTGVGRFFDPNPIAFRVGSDATGLLIYTNQEDAVVEYAIRPSDIWNYADAGFKDAFAWRLSAALAPSLAVPDPTREEQQGQSLKAGEPRKENARSENAMVQLRRFRLETAKWAWAMYERALSIAKAATANEMQPEKSGDADWITGRN